MGTLLGNGAKRRENFEIREEHFEIWEEHFEIWEAIPPNPGEIGTEADQLSVDQ